LKRCGQVAADNLHGGLKYSSCAGCYFHALEIESMKDGCFAEVRSGGVSDYGGVYSIG
jgi:hypothetical protein